MPARPAPVQAGGLGAKLKAMHQFRSWQERWAWVAGLLAARTGEGLEMWNRRVLDSGLPDPAALRAWLADQGVDGYPRMLLIMERFGYPDYLTADAADLVDAQYADRPGLRPIFDGILAVAAGLGEVDVQARKTYVTLVSPRRTFAAIKATTRSRVDLGMRLDGLAPAGRLLSAAGVGSDSINLRIGLATPQEIDDEVVAWLGRAYRESS